MDEPPTFQPPPTGSEPPIFEPPPFMDEPLPCEAGYYYSVEQQQCVQSYACAQPQAYRNAFWSMPTSPCEMDKSGCITSSNYRYGGEYGNNEDCTICVRQPLM